MPYAGFRYPHQLRISYRSWKGFTLVELLVVVGIIALLVAMLLPALNKARVQSRTVQCMSNLRQTFLALTNYAQQYREYPTLTTWQIQAATNGPEAQANGSDVFAMLVNQKFITEKAAQCITTDSASGLWTFDNFSTKPWYRYFGPSANGYWTWHYGHGSNFTYYGWIWFTWPDPNYNGSRGASYRKLEKRRGNWYEYRAFLACPRTLTCDPFWTFARAFEPHGTQPLSAATGSQCQFDNLVPTKDRNYAFTDGHVEYIRVK